MCSMLLIKKHKNKKQRGQNNGALKIRQDIRHKAQNLEFLGKTGNLFTLHEHDPVRSFPPTEQQPPFLFPHFSFFYSWD